METTQCDKPQSLLLITLDLINKDERKLPDLYKETGIPFYWLRKFKAGQIPNPSVNRIQFLYEFLSGQSLSVSQD